MITSLKIHNFKSLRNVELTDLPSFMTVVGANASGKSNFIKALDFLFQIMTNGLTNAMDNYGGYEGICYRKARRSKGAIKFGFQLHDELPEIESMGIGGFSIKLIYNYEFEFQATKQAIDSPYQVMFETLTVDGVDKTNDRKTNIFQFSREKDKIEIYHFNKQAIQQIDMLDMPPKEYITGRKPNPTDLFLAQIQYGLIAGLFSHFSTCKAYFINPEEARKPVSDTSSAGTILNKYGNNLASVVKYLRTEEPEIYENLIEHVQVAAPTIESVNSQYTDSKQLSYNIKERDFGRPWHPKEVSDGTLETLCLFIPLEDERIRLAAYDEPENSVHPWIQEHFVKTCLDKSEEKQIILSTHSREIVDEVPPESLFVIERNNSGESEIRQVQNYYPHVKRIVDKKIMPLGEYWKSGAVGGVPGQIPLEFPSE